MASWRRLVGAMAVAVGLGAGTVWAGPQDTRPGEVRVVYARQGTALRAEGAALGAVVATLPAGTNVTVVEVKLPWVRVQAATAAGPVEGWLRAYEAIEPGALARPASPPPPTGTGAAGVGAREVSAAGRQFDSATEASYRTSRADLVRGYQLVDQLERETAALNPYDSVAFVMEGEIGRRGRDYLLPGRLPPDPPRARGGRGGGGGIDLGKVGGFLGKTGLLGGKDAERLDRLGGLVSAVSELSSQMSKKFTPQQEYYLGRAVAAQAYARYGVDRNEARRRYVRQVGDAIVRLADPRVPNNFGGYHFDVLDSAEVNGVSGPGGFVFVTRGAVEACRTEDELAGILAHELAHVVAGHGEAVIRRSEGFQSELKVFGGLAKAAGLTDDRIANQLVSLFTSAVAEAGRVSIDHAYGQELEFAADRDGTYLLYEVFYDWTALRSVLGRMGHAPHAHRGATHAPPAARAAALDGVIAPYGQFQVRAGVQEARLARFQQHAGAPR